jgi:multidrug efflux pump subunit AcrA (membrane-fusion protein)
MVNSNFLESQTKNLQSALQQLVDALSELDLIAQKERTNLLRHPSDLISQALDTFTELSQQLEKVQIELINLRALAEISQVVNSSLEVNEVLRIVMDTIIRLTGAERAFSC